MRTICISILVAFWTISLQAQVTAEQNVFSSLGTFTSSGSFSVSATMGESLIESKFLSGNFSVMQGFQQPTILLPDAIGDLSDAPFQLNAFPNPVGAVLNLELSGTVAKPIRLQLFDAQGRAINQWDFEVSHTGITQRSMEELASGMYMLRISQPSSNYAGSLRILKQ